MASKYSISKLRAKINPEHQNYMGPECPTTPAGQKALRLIEAYDPGRPTPGRSTAAAKMAVRTQLRTIQTTMEATNEITERLLQRAEGKIPDRRPDQSAGERKREIDQVLPVLRAERQKIAKEKKEEKMTEL